MDLTILTGDDEQRIDQLRREFFDLAAGQLISLDASTDASTFFEAVSAVSLFGGTRYVWLREFEQLSPSQVDRLVMLAPGSSASVLARTATLAPAVRNKLKAVANFSSCSSPRGREIGERVGEMLKDAGVTLDPDSRRRVVARAGHDLPRAYSMIRQFSLLGLTHPKARQVDVMLGSSIAPGVPWDLGDHIERGAAGEALTVSGELNPLAAHGYLTSRFINAARVAENSCHDAAEVMKLLNSKSRFSAEKMLRLSRRLGVVRLHQAVQVLASYDTLLKEARNQHAVFDLLTIELSAICADA